MYDIKILSAIIEQLVPGAQYSIHNGGLEEDIHSLEYKLSDDYILLWSKSNTINAPSENDILSQYDTMVRNKECEKIKAVIQQLLSDTDFYMLPDSPISKNKSLIKQFKEYRAALRDIKNQENYPNDIIWPIKPTT
jgi:hypothetical protein